MRTTEEVTIILGETSERTFTVNVTCDYDKGDYNNPPSAEYYLDSDIQEDGSECNKLIDRYESIYKVDFESLAIEEFRNEY
mgnify:CR=1 FL=1|tara:strand:- start:132 stop:374 length:243 start_codon:yes stop_codon:yes gene_type:complete